MKEQIIKILKRNSGLKAREIAYFLSTERREVNRVLYFENNGMFRRDDYYRWYLATDRAIEKESCDIEVMDAIKGINSIHEIIDNIVNNDSSVFFPKTFSGAKFESYDRLLLNIDSSILAFCFDIYGTGSPNDFYIDDEIFDEIYERIGSAFDSEISVEYFGTFNGFYTRIGYVPSFLCGLAEYDLKNQTMFGSLVLKCFETLGECIVEVFKYDYEDNDEDDMYPNHIERMREFLENYTSSSDTSVNHIEDEEVDEDDEDSLNESSSEMSECSGCGESCEVDYLIEGEDGELYCSVCFEEMTEENESVKKKDIIESCSTCKFKKNGTCAKSRLNLMCKDYLYAI